MPGNARLTASMSCCVVGAEPILTARTEERSVRASVSVSRTMSASMVGTEVRKVTPKRPIASMYRRASNCGSRTMVACPARATLLVPSAFMWKSGAATMKRCLSRSLAAVTRDLTAQSWPSWDSGTPLGRPVEPDV